MLDEILAGILRKFLMSLHDNVQWSSSEDDEEDYSMTVEATIPLTLEEIAALNEAFSDLDWETA